jgi:uncharacterized repeat protein (TIGR03803 family)
MYCANVPTFAILFLAVLLAAAPAQAQTFSVIHGFTGEQDGANPAASLTLDAGGNIYGTAFGGNTIAGRDCGSNGGCGIVFRMKRHNSSWILTPLYSFTGFNDGAGPYAPVSFGPGGLLYGSASGGGSGNCTDGYFLGCGVVFTLQPPATACSAALCPWNETPIYQFANFNDGVYPGGNLAFDTAGNAYGTTQNGGNGNCRLGCGIVYKLARSGSGWVKSTIYEFTGGADGGYPYSGPILDHAGNVYGVTTAGGAHGFGVVYELTPSGLGWTENVIYSFQNTFDGREPFGGLVMDAAGNLYGSTYSGGIGCGGTVFELSPSNGGWSFAVLYGLTGGNQGGGPESSLTFDSGGNLYGTTWGDGAFQCGNVFKLTPSNGHWNYTDLHDFTCGNDGGSPIGGVVVDSAGNLYGSTLYYGPSGQRYCGVDAAPVGCGVVWSITP